MSKTETAKTNNSKVFNSIVLAYSAIGLQLVNSYFNTSLNKLPNFILIPLEIILTVNAFCELYNDNAFDISSIFEDSENVDQSSQPLKETDTIGLVIDDE